MTSESEFDYGMFYSAEARLDAFNHSDIWFADATEDARFYLDTLTELIASQEKKEWQRLKGVAEGIPESRRAEFLEYHYPYHWENIFQENLKESFFISLLSILEFYLKNACQALHNGKMKELTKYKGITFLDKVHNYLCDCIKGDLSDLKWDTIHRLWRIRNALVHSQGSCFGHRDEESIKEFVDENDGISMSNGWIQIESTFCKRALITVREFGFNLGTIIRTELTNRSKSPP